MSETATGSIKSAGSGTKFNGQFFINGIEFDFTGDMDPSVASFSVTRATLTYSSTQDLTGTRFLDGQIGPTNVSISLFNGPTITGKLDTAFGEADTSTIVGSGTWTER